LQFSVTFGYPLGKLPFYRWFSQLETCIDRGLSWIVHCHVWLPEGKPIH
jgi:hypothetical protein